MVFFYLDGSSGEGATDLHSIGDDGGGDDLVVGHFLHDLVVHSSERSRPKKSSSLYFFLCEQYSAPSEH